jgi:flagellar hook-length control protein FliK
MAVQSASPIADLAPVRTPHRDGRSEPRDERFVVPGTEDSRPKHKATTERPDAPAEQPHNDGEATVRSETGRADVFETGTPRSDDTTVPGDAAESRDAATDASAAFLALQPSVESTKPPVPQNVAGMPVTAGTTEMGLADGSVAGSAAADVPVGKTAPANAAAPASEPDATGEAPEKTATPAADAPPAQPEISQQARSSAPVPPTDGSPAQRPTEPAPPAGTPAEASPAPAVVAAVQSALAGTDAQTATVDGAATAEDGDPDGEPGPSSAKRSEGGATPRAAAGAPVASAVTDGNQAAANGTGGNPGATFDSVAKSNNQIAAQTIAESGGRPAGDTALAPAQSGSTAQPTFQTELRHAVDVAAQSAAGTRTPPSAHPAAEQVALHISRAADQPGDKLTVHLKPADLGKVTIELDVGPDNRVIAVISVEKSETLDLLQRDARALERALNDAGLRADTGSLQFNLQGNGDQAKGNGRRDGLDGAIMMPEGSGGEADVPAPALYRPLILPEGRVDIQV